MSLHEQTKTGFTLVEVLVSMTLAAIGATLAMQLWFQFFATLIDRNKSNQASLGRELQIAALENRIARGCGIEFISESRLEWKDCRTGTHRLEQQGDSIWLDGHKVLSDSTQSISFSVLGPSFIPSSTDSTIKAWVDLDGNQDGYLGFSEMDKDYSQSLEGNELKYANLLVVHIQSNGASTQELKILIRNHE